MGYCYFCEVAWTGYVSYTYFCENCEKLRQITKILGADKITDKIEFRINNDTEMVKIENKQDTEESDEGVKTRSKTKKSKSYSQALIFNA